ncbi:hypothetical protein [Xanthobacter sp. 91]|nr:hypothetical protein [Xanthobacter sp. 91]
MKVHRGRLYDQTLVIVTTGFKDGVALGGLGEVRFAHRGLLA